MNYMINKKITFVFILLLISHVLFAISITPDSTSICDSYDGQSSLSNITDSDVNTGVGFAAGSSNIWIEFQLNENYLLNYISLNANIPIDNEIVIDVFKDSMFIPLISSFTKTKGSTDQNYLIDLSFENQVTDKIRFRVEGDSCTASVINEIGIDGVSISDYDYKSYVGIVKATDNSSHFNHYSNMFDGNIYSGWYINQDDTDNNYPDMVNEVNSELGSAVETPSGSDGYIEFDWSLSPKKLKDVKIYFLADVCGTFEYEFKQNGFWSTRTQIDYSANQWRNLSGFGTEDVESFRLHIIRGSANPNSNNQIGGIGEIEFECSGDYQGDKVREVIPEVFRDPDFYQSEINFDLNVDDGNNPELEVLLDHSYGTSTIFKLNDKQITPDKNVQLDAFTLLRFIPDDSYFKNGINNLKLDGDVMLSGVRYARIRLTHEDGYKYYGNTSLNDEFLYRNAGTTGNPFIQEIWPDRFFVDDVELWGDNAESSEIQLRFDNVWSQNLTKSDEGAYTLFDGESQGAGAIRIYNLGDDTAEWRIKGDFERQDKPLFKIISPKPYSTIEDLSGTEEYLWGVFSGTNDNITINNIDAETRGNVFWFPLSSLNISDYGKQDILVELSDSSDNVLVDDSVSFNYNMAEYLINIDQNESFYYSNTANFEISGIVSNSDTAIEITNGADLYTVPIDQLAFLQNILLYEGSNTIEVIGKSIATGVKVFSRTITVFYTTDTLTLEIEQPVDNSRTKDSEIKVVGKVNGVGTETVIVNGISCEVDNNRFESGLISLNEGENNISIVASDEIGSQISEIYTIVKDTIKPVVSNINIFDGQWINSHTYNVSGTVNDASDVNVFVNNLYANVNGSTFNFNIELSEGQNIVNIYADDGLNQSDGIALTLNSDTTPPSNFNITCNPSPVSVNGKEYINVDTISLLFQSTDSGSGISEYSYSVNGGSYNIIETDLGNPVLNLSEVEDGSYTYIISAVDNVGWNTTAIYKIVVDTTSPRAPEDFRAVPSRDIDEFETIHFFQTFKWSAPVGDDSDISNYKLYRYIGEDVDGNLILEPLTENIDGSDVDVIIQRNAGEVFSYTDPETEVEYEMLVFSIKYEKEVTSEDYDDEYFIEAIDYAGNDATDLAGNKDKTLLETTGLVSVAYVKKEYIPEVGAVVEYDNLNLMVKDNTLPDEVEEIKITEIESEDLINAADNKIISPIYDFSVLMNEGGEITEKSHIEFEQDFMCLLKYDDTKLVDAYQDFPEEDLGVYYYDQMWGRWFEVKNAAVDTENNTFYFSTNHFSSFAVQPKLIPDYTPQELVDIEFSPTKSMISHEGVSVSPQDGTVTTKATELVLPGKNGFDFVLERYYDTATARTDGSDINLGIKIGLNAASLLNGDLANAIEYATNLIGLGIQLSTAFEAMIKNYNQNNGDYAYSTGMGWRFNFPYIRGANSSILIRLPDGTFHNINAMDIVDKEYEDLNTTRILVLENHERNDFTLKVKQKLRDLSVVGIISGTQGIPGWVLDGAELTMRNGTTYFFDSFGRTTKIADPAGLNEITFTYTDDYKIHHITDSMGRRIRFEYKDLASSNIYSMRPIIDKIYIDENSNNIKDIQESYIEYTYGNPDGFNTPAELPLLRASKDFEGRTNQYNYDDQFLFSGNIGFKVNGVALLADILTSSTFSTVAELIGFDSAITIYGQTQAEFIYPLNNFSGTYTGEYFVNYGVSSLTYADAELDDKLFGIIPTAISVEMNLVQKLHADKLVFKNGLTTNTTNFVYDFRYKKYDQFYNRETIVTDNRGRKIYNYTPVIKTRYNWIDYIDALIDITNGDILFAESPTVHEIIPKNTKIQVFQKNSDSSYNLLETTYYEEDDLFRLQSKLTQRGGPAHQITYDYDDWGNPVHIVDTRVNGDRVLTNETWNNYYFVSGGVSLSNFGTEYSNALSLGLISDPSSRGHYANNLLKISYIKSESIDDGVLFSNENIYKFFDYSLNGLLEKESVKLTGTFDTGWNGEVWTGESTVDRYSTTSYTRDSTTGEIISILFPEGHERDIDYNYPTVFDSNSVYTITTTDKSMPVYETTGENSKETSSDIITVKEYFWGNGFLKSKTNGRGNATSYEYDAVGRIIKVSKPESAITNIIYNDTLRTSTVTNSLGAVTVYSFDSAGNLTEIKNVNRERDYSDKGTVVENGTVENYITSITYDAWGNITSVLKPENQGNNNLKTNYYYDVMDNLIKVIYPEVNGTRAQKSISINYSTGLSTEDYYNDVNSSTILKTIQKYYDWDDNLISQSFINPSGSNIEEVIWFNGLGKKVKEKDGNDNVTLYDYNELGLLQLITYPKDNFYDGISEYNNVNPMTKINYDKSGHKTSETNTVYSNGRTTEKIHFFNDGLGRIVLQSVEVDGNEQSEIVKTEIWYDAVGNITSQIDGNGNEYRKIYTKRNQLESEIDPLGYISSYTYDTEDNQTSFTDPRGNIEIPYPGADFSIDYYYDDQNRLIIGILPDSASGTDKAVKLYYDGNNNLTNRIEPDGGSYTYDYDSRNKLVLESKNTGSLTYSSKKEYDSFGNLRYETAFDSAINIDTNPAAHDTVTEHRYDFKDRQVKVIYPHLNDSTAETYTYDGNDNVLTFKDGRGNLKSFEYNTKNQLIKEKASLEGATVTLNEYKYDAKGNNTQVEVYKETGNLATDKLFDQMNRMIKEIRPNNVEYLYDYDNTVNLVKETKPTGLTGSSDNIVLNYIYNDNYTLKELNSVYGEMTQKQTFDYDEIGFVKESISLYFTDDGSADYMDSAYVRTEYNSQSGTYSPDPFGRIYNQKTTIGQLEKPVGGGEPVVSTEKVTDVSYDYDEMNRRTAVTYDSDKIVNYAYDKLGRIKSVSDYVNDGGVIYNSRGFIDTLTAVNGIKRSFTYDNSGRRNDIKYESKGREIKSYQLRYDNADNIVSIKGGSNDYRYDSLNRLIGADVLTGWLLDPNEMTGIWKQETDHAESDYGAQSYDTLTSDIIPAENVMLDYAASSIWIELDNQYRTTAIELVPIEFDHRVKKRHLQIYTSTGTDFTKLDENDWQFVRDENGKVVISFRMPIIAKYVKVHCHWNEMNLLGVSLNDGGTFQNNEDDLMKVWYLSNKRTEDYSYYLNGDRDSSDTTNRVGGNTEHTDYYYYAGTTRVSQDGKYQYTYDRSGNLVTKTRIGVPSDETTYTYDLFNRLIKVSVGSSKVVRYTYDHNSYRVKRESAGIVSYFTFDTGGNVLSEQKGTDNTDYVFILGKHFAEVMNGETSYCITDHLGSIIMKTNDDGDVIWQEDFSPFGEKSGQAGYENHEGKYTGKDQDIDTGLYYFNARWYDASLGRFTTEDPAKSGLNWYAYANNNPLKFVDPTGLSEVNGAGGVGGKIDLGGDAGSGDAGSGDAKNSESSTSESNTSPTNSSVTYEGVIVENMESSIALPKPEANINQADADINELIKRLGRYGDPRGKNNLSSSEGLWKQSDYHDKAYFVGIAETSRQSTVETISSESNKGIISFIGPLSGGSMNYGTVNLYTWKIRYSNKILGWEVTTQIMIEDESGISGINSPTYPEGPPLPNDQAIKVLQNHPNLAKQALGLDKRSRFRKFWDDLIN